MGWVTIIECDSCARRQLPSDEFLSRREQVERLYDLGGAAFLVGSDTDVFVESRENAARTSGTTLHRFLCADCMAARPVKLFSGETIPADVEPA
jgi:hypothetical protein